MRLIRRILSQLHRYVLWALLSVLLWGWIFTAFVTDASPAHKVTVYVNTVAVRDTALEEALDYDLPKGVRMVKVHPFSYAAFFDTAAPNEADLYLWNESDLLANLELLCPMEPHGDGDYLADGVVYGWRMYDAETGTGAASDYFTYGEGENWYLCARVSSFHLGTWNDAKDDAAILIAKRLIELP